MCLTPTTPDAAFSTFLVTWVSSSLGAAPVWTIVIVTIGMSMLGIWVIGRVFRLTAPSAISTTKSTNDGIGLRIDQAEMLRAISTSSRGFRVIADRHDRFARPGKGCGADHDLLAFHQTVDDLDPGAAFEASFDVADFDDIVGCQLDVGASLAEQHRRQRHGDGLSPSDGNVAAGKNAGSHGRMARQRDRDAAEPAQLVDAWIDQPHSADDGLADAGQPNFDVLAWHDLRQHGFRNLGVKFDFTVAHQLEERLAHRAGDGAEAGGAARYGSVCRRLQLGSRDLQFDL